MIGALRHGPGAILLALDFALGPSAASAARGDQEKAALAQRLITGLLSADYEVVFASDCDIVIFEAAEDQYEELTFNFDAIDPAETIYHLDSSLMEFVTVGNRIYSRRLVGADEYEEAEKSFVLLAQRPHEPQDRAKAPEAFSLVIGYLAETCGG